jgi:hypothetical protein
MRVQRRQFYSIRGASIIRPTHSQGPRHFKDMTTGTDVERWLNDRYGAGRTYRRSCIAEPSDRTSDSSLRNQGEARVWDDCGERLGGAGRLGW